MMVGKSKYPFLRSLEAYCKNKEVKVVVQSLDAYNELCKYIPKDNIVFSDAIRGNEIEQMWIDEEFA